MARNYEFEVDDETINILKDGTIENNVYYLPKVNLEREIYEKVDKVLKALGAKWNRKSKGHKFEYDISEELKYVYKDKKVIDWKKATDFFYTPEKVVDIMISAYPLYYAEKYKFLEPSCGQGHIVDKLHKLFENTEITCIEKNRMHCEFMKNKGYMPICADFLDIEPDPSYDAVFMNPPFTDEVDHIRHAYEFVKDGGYLISVASGNILENSNKKTQEFKKWFKEKEGYCYKLPPESFKEAGTNVSTVLLLFEKDEYQD